jgi:antitoxin component YwqK of YwqJK toxin-antitoxin module
VQAAPAARARDLAVMLACATSVFFASCSRPRDTPEKAGITATYDSKTGKLTELAYDSNHNGKVETWTEMDGNRPVRTRIDTNEDGKIDRWEYYDAGSKLVKIGFSRSDAGKPDAWAFSGDDGKTRRVEISSTFDEHKIDRWEHYLGESITAAEEDTDHDGRIDKWEAYSDGALETAAFDENGDGKADRRLTYADGALVAIDSDPDPSGTFRKHVVVEQK